MEPVISVVMPAYNAERFIGEAIASVKAQSFEDWELIVIDDCSADGTYDIAGELARSDERIRVLRNERNLGAAGTRNRAFELCRGSFVALLDSDDFWAPLKLEKQLACAESTGADIVGCSYAVVDERGNRRSGDFIIPEAVDFDLMLGRSVLSCSTAFLKREVVEAHKFPKGVYHEDYAYWMLLLREGAKAAGVKEVLASYRIVEGSKASNKLRCAVNRWRVYRKFLRLPLFTSVKAMGRYAFWGLRKYKKETK